MVSVVKETDCNKWYLNKMLHREDGPAIEYMNGRKEWYKNGVLHRDNGPAIIWSNGMTEWFQQGIRHREDGPAREYVNGRKEWIRYGLRHRDDGPAIEDPCKNEIVWFKHGYLHRLDGPATNVYYPYWIINGHPLLREELKIYKRTRIQSMAMALSPLELPPYCVLWILQWSEAAYINELSEIAIVKMLEGIYQARLKLRHNISM